ncbi:MAG: rhamnulokinase [Planctomycetes bacterium]|nr:rhamnulokinase [Planctomycetota bacterium]
MATYLAYDLGAESGRGVAGTLRDGKLTIEEVHRFWNLPVTIQGTLYWDVYGLCRELVAALGKFKERVGAPPAAMGIDTWGVDFGLLARDGSLLAPPVCYRDHRNDATMGEVLKKIPAERIYDATGIQFMQFNSIFQLAGIRHRTPKVLEAADAVLFMGDLLAWFFTGRKANEYTLASTSQLIDPRTRQWATELLRELGLPQRIFPELVEPGTVLGNVARAIAGNDTIPFVAVAHHDTGSAVAAVPAEGNDWACISCGTWSIMGVELSQPMINEATRAANFTNEGGVAGTTRFMKNLAGLWPLQECRRKWIQSEPDLNYTVITEQAAAAKPFAAVLDIDNDAFLNPLDMPAAIADQCRKTGQQPPADMGSMARVILEGLALGYRRRLDELEKLTGRTFDKVHIVGGGTQNRLLMQFAANAMGRPVVAGPIEATAIGNIMMQAIATGELSSLAEGRAMVRRSFPMETFEPTNTAPWSEAYAKLKKML